MKQNEELHFQQLAVRMGGKSQRILKLKRKRLNNKEEASRIAASSQYYHNLRVNWVYLQKGKMGKRQEGLQSPSKWSAFAPPPPPQFPSKVTSGHVVQRRRVKDPFSCGDLQPTNQSLATLLWSANCPRILPILIERERKKTKEKRVKAKARQRKVKQRTEEVAVRINQPFSMTISSTSRPFFSS